MKFAKSTNPPEYTEIVNINESSSESNSPLFSYTITPLHILNGSILI
jgi:hypothetical protein